MADASIAEVVTGSEDSVSMKLHLGCGPRHIPGFLHIDLCDLPHIDHRSPIDELAMIEDGAASLIYASHCLEYFDREEAGSVLREWWRVLGPGGVLRLAVPDFDALIELYARSGEIAKMLGPLYGRMKVKTESGEILLYHRTVYNFESLSALLRDSGFGEVKRYRWQDTIHSAHDDFSQSYHPHMDKENGLLISLNVEGVKLG